MSFVDPEREEWMLQYLARANRGPLSADGLQELFDGILGLTKREVERGVRLVLFRPRPRRTRPA